MSSASPSFFKIGEVSRIVGVEPHVLRYWESVFPQLAPEKSRGNHRVYGRKDVDMALTIKHLLYDDRMTVEGAQRQLSRSGRSTPPTALLAAIGREVRALLAAVDEEDVETADDC